MGDIQWSSLARGKWIEAWRRIPKPEPSTSSLARGKWIEALLHLSLNGHSLSSLARGKWIEASQVSLCKTLQNCLPSQEGSGLKHYCESEDDYYIGLPSQEGSGLKHGPVGACSERLGLPSQEGSGLKHGNDVRLNDCCKVFPRKREVD